MKGKRLLAALMASAMALGMTACSGSGGGSSSGGGGNSGGGSSASDFPTKSVTIIMPWSLGGGPDTIARQVASYGDKYLGVPVIVENKTGGAGTIAMNAALQAADDGYTMVVANGPLFSLTPSFQNVNYTLDDITPLIGMRTTEFVVLTNAKSGLTSIDDLKAYAAKGNTIKYATTGGQDAINALSGGHVDVAIGSPPVYRDYVINGEFNCLGTFIPDGIDVDGIGHIPSFKDQGIDVEFTGMDYFAVRSSVSDDAKAKLTEFIQKVYADEDFQKFMADLGMEAWPATEDEIKSMISDQTEAMKAYIPLLK